jgi:hypothetical protein
MEWAVIGTGVALTAMALALLAYRDAYFGWQERRSQRGKVPLGGRRVQIVGLSLIVCEGLFFIALGLLKAA